MVFQLPGFQQFIIQWSLESLLTSRRSCWDPAEEFALGRLIISETGHSSWSNVCAAFTFKLYLAKSDWQTWTYCNMDFKLSMFPSVSYPYLLEHKYNSFTSSRWPIEKCGFLKMTISLHRTILPGYNNTERFQYGHIVTHGLNHYWISTEWAGGCSAALTLYTRGVQLKFK